ncbi:replicative DNA helicase [Glutamicibacter sp. AOP5-A2-18]|uniref:replicative DNA helicase n=1 Tax=Glutamicibacter sp. AOP5-A2-18 TaxID=3457656 RepID=UPI004033BBE9
MEQPNSVERSIIGMIVTTRGAILSQMTLDPSDYYSKTYEAIHRAALTMYNERRGISQLTLEDELKSSEVRVDPIDIREAAQALPDYDNIEVLENIVSESATRRRLKAVFQGAEQAIGSPVDIGDTVEETQLRMQDAVAGSKGPKVSFLSDDVDEIIAALDEVHDYPKTPWPDLDKIIGGLRPGNVYVIGARPGVGKSVLGMQFAQAMEKNGAVPFISLEMGKTEIGKRLIANETEISLSRIDSGNLHDKERAIIAKWRANRIENGRLAILNESLTMSQIKKFVHSVNRRQKISGIVIDYLQLINAPSGDRRPRHELIAETSRQAKMLSVDYGVPVILLSQVNRNSTQDDNPPKMSELRESGAIEQDASVVILLHRAISGSDEEAKTTLQVGVAKNRHGTTGSFDLQFKGYYQKAVQ